jgi:hypothetical protein
MINVHLEDGSEMWAVPRGVKATIWSKLVHILISIRIVPVSLTKTGNVMKMCELKITNFIVNP